MARVNEESGGGVFGIEHLFKEPFFVLSSTPLIPFKCRQTVKSTRLKCLRLMLSEVTLPLLELHEYIPQTLRVMVF